MSDAVLFNDARIVVQKRWIPWAVIAAPLAYAAFLAFGNAAPVGQAFQFLVMGLSFRQRALRDNWKGTELRGRARVDAAGVWREDRLLVARATIADAVWTPAEGGGLVRFLDRSRHVLCDLAVTDENEALSVLSVIGIDPSRRRARFTATSSMIATTRNMMIGLIPAFACVVGSLATWRTGGASSFMGIGIGLFWLPFLLAFAFPTDVEVGADGVLVRSAFGRRYTAFADMVAVAFAKDTIDIVLRDGTGTKIKLGGFWGQTAVDLETRGKTLAARLEAGMKAQRERAEGVPIASLLARGTREGREWVADLQRLRDGTSTYRSGEIREDDLWRVVDDTSAPADARAAAAFLLRKGEAARESTRVRLRVASEATASPELRVAFEAEDDATAEEALAELGRR